MPLKSHCSKSPTHGVLYDNTRKLVEDLEIVIRRGIKGCTRVHFNVKLDYKNFVWDKNCADFRKLLKEVREIRVAIDRNFPREEVTFDGHMAIGRTLQHYNLLTEPLQSFQRAADLRPIDVWPQFEVGKCLSDLGRWDEAKEMGRYHRAAELYGRVGFPANFWRVQANQVVSLCRAGEIVDARKASKELRKGLHKMTGAAEVYSTLRYMVDANDHQLQKKMKKKKNHGGLLSSTLAKFKRACEKTIRRKCLADALIRHNKEFQRNTKLNLFKEINQKILSVLDSTRSGRVEFGMFYAVIAPTCAGEPKNCKRAAFDALLWQSRRKEGRDVMEKVDALKYMRYLRLLYFPSQGCSTTDQLVGHVEEENTMISFCSSSRERVL
ncbi:uncharacterized TPR repeat-containing protein At1g05150-like [Macadamia integrifolia]|uniref:uncharacterized TPR repeat-containing protein At1g05150-like n=1 Tax=Macadamia integrifolia TaxID=60698 RepID=UPI001C528BE8|nr:uncharacterized TPR repeat-containing protein At1g05150-like [Macadamia integrifolia]